MPKYWCELRVRNGTTDGLAVLVEVDAEEWPVMPECIVYHGRLYTRQADHRYREARVFWYSARTEA